MEINEIILKDRHKTPDQNTFRDSRGDFLEFETDSEIFWFDITPKNRENETLQTVELDKDEFIRLVDYLVEVKQNYCR